MRVTLVAVVVLGVTIAVAARTDLGDPPQGSDQQTAWALDETCARAAVADLSIFWATSSVSLSPELPAPLVELVPGATRGRLGFQREFEPRRPIPSSGELCGAAPFTNAAIRGVNAATIIEDSCLSTRRLVVDQIVIETDPVDAASGGELPLVIDPNDRSRPVGLMHAVGAGVAVVNPGGDVFQWSQLGWNRRELLNRMKGSDRLSAVEKVAAVQERLTASLLAVPEVVGTMTAVGPSPEIVVLTAAAVRSQDEPIPEMIDGVRVTTKVVGPLRSLGPCGGR